MKNILFLTLIGLLALSCNEDTEDQNGKLLTFQKGQGQCGETWGDTFLDYEPEKAIEAATGLLENLELPAEGMTIDSLDMGAICATCHDCPSGRYYVLTADEQYEQRLLDLQFTRR